jgi:hypothetical protein
MVATAERTQTFSAPWLLVPQVFEHYRSEHEVLRELSRQWWSAFAGAVYVALEAGEGDLVADVSSAYAEVRRRHDALRRILEAHVDHPAIAAAMAKEQRLLRGVLGGRLRSAPPLDRAA